MSKQVWKFALVGTQAEIAMPAGAHILALQMQAGQPCIWAMVDTAATQEARTFVTVGTGHHIYDPEKLSYVGTFQIPDAGLVFHVFEFRIGPSAGPRR